MAVTCLDAAANSGAIETAITDWETATSPTSIDHVDVEKTGRDHVLITIIYSTA